MRLSEVLVDRGHDVSWYSAPLIQRQYSKSLGFDGDKEYGDDINDIIYSRGVVVIDDFLTGEWARTTPEFWYQVFDVRLSKGLTTWLSSNKTPDEMNHVILELCEGDKLKRDRIYRRLLELCKFINV